MTKECHFIDGRWTGSNKSSALSSINPATEKTIWTGFSAGKDLVDQAVAAARSAFSDWSNLELEERIAYLEKFRASLLKNKPQLTEAISINTGKPLWEAATEVMAMANKITISIEAFKVRCPTIQKQQTHALAITSHRPHGVMVVLGPFNFPGHLPNGHIIPALLAGNTVVFKPSELAPLVAEATFKCWEESNLPPGVINMVQGARETGQLLAEHEDIDGLLFTGSWNTGKYLSEHFAKTPYKILALEMGGNNPLIVGTISDFKAAAYITVQSAYITAGQRCTCARRLIVQKGYTGDQFLQTLAETIKAIQVGPYDEASEPFMGPVISSHAAEHLIEAQKRLIEGGAKAIILMTRMEKGAAFLSPGLIDVTDVANRPDEEYFGPLLQVIRVNNFKEALAEANNTNYGLVAGILTDNDDEFKTFYKNARAGIINRNAPLTGASSAAPFGGIGKSGNNRPSAFYAADYCSYPTASIIAEKLHFPAEINPGIHLKQG